jgi:integrase
MKDFRHLFATMLANSAVAEGYRRYLLGHTPGRAAAVAYTHLNELPEHYAGALRRHWKSVIDLINGRLT